jgi:acyl carrier protein
LRTPTIGRAISGAAIYLLDDEGREVPAGVQGEIYIGGTGVGRGYRGLPEATRLAFLADPFSSSPNARMYRSGDRGVRTENGEIEFRGRLDRQIKIRGQRIELDEISSALGCHPDIDFATATMSSEPEQERLVAHVLPKQGCVIPTAGELQQYLIERLPSYMVPSVFVRLQRIPLTPNGKVDFAALESPSSANTLAVKAARPPATPIEERLLVMARELLHREDVGLDDDFFLVGGHSLIGMQLVLRLREIFGVDFTLMQLFQAPTVEKMASAIEALLIERIQAMSGEEVSMQVLDQ